MPSNEWEWPSKRRKSAWIQDFWPVTLPCDTGLIRFVSIRPHKRMIAKGKRTALLNDKFSRAVLLALFFFSPRNILKGNWDYTEHNSKPFLLLPGAEGRRRRDFSAVDVLLGWFAMGCRRSLIPIMCSWYKAPVPMVFPLTVKAVGQERSAITQSSSTISSLILARVLLL